MQWLPVPEALERLSYQHDATVLGAFAALPPITGVVVLVRHAHAGTREAWAGPDTARPLDAAGDIAARCPYRGWFRRDFGVRVKSG